MTAGFRHVVGSPDDPVELWPYEALVATIERGTVRDWIPILQAIRAEPWGLIAQQVEDYLDYATPYGVGPLLTRRIMSARAEREQGERDAVAAQVRSLVAASGLTRAEFAKRIGTSASRLSTYCTGRVTPSAALVLRMQTEAQRSASHDR